MATIFQDPDYKNHYFKCSELTKVEDEPDLQSLIKLRNEVKANAMTVHTTLGGGAYGHLGLVLTPEQYAYTPNTEPYERPNSPNTKLQPSEINIKKTSDFSEKLHQSSE